MRMGTPPRARLVAGDDVVADLHALHTLAHALDHAGGLMPQHAREQALRVCARRPPVCVRTCAVRARAAAHGTQTGARAAVRQLTHLSSAAWKHGKALQQENLLSAGGAAGHTFSVKRVRVCMA